MCRKAEAALSDPDLFGTSIPLEGQVGTGFAVNGRNADVFGQSPGPEIRSPRVGRKVVRDGDLVASLQDQDHPVFPVLVGVVSPQAEAVAPPAASVANAALHGHGCHLVETTDFPAPPQSRQVPLIQDPSLVHVQPVGAIAGLAKICEEARENDAGDDVFHGTEKDHHQSGNGTSHGEDGEEGLERRIQIDTMETGLRVKFDLGTFSYEALRLAARLGTASASLPAAFVVKAAAVRTPDPLASFFGISAVAAAYAVSVHGLHPFPRKLTMGLPW